MTDFKALLRVLSESGVEFILVGGVAATVHGSTRLTADVDVVYERRRPNLDRLALALTPYHPYLRGAPPGLPVGCSWNWRYSKNQTAILAPPTRVNRPHHQARGFDQAREVDRARHSRLIDRSACNRNDI